MTALELFGWLITLAVAGCAGVWLLVVAVVLRNIAQLVRRLWRRRRAA